MLGADSEFLGGEIGKEWLSVLGTHRGPVGLCHFHTLIPSPTTLGSQGFFLTTLGMVGAGTLSKGLLLYLDHLIYCSMW